VASTALSIRRATVDDVVEIERMVADFVKGHPAENHPRSRDALREALFGEHPVAHLLVAERRNEVVGMVQWRLIFDIFWGMLGAQADWLYVEPRSRGSGIVAALVARLCAEAAQAGAKFVQGGGGEGPSKLYERVAIGHADRTCHLSAKAFQAFAALDG
jgi:predicted N-acetyltransferase YhbS